MDKQIPILCSRLLSIRQGIKLLLEAPEEHALQDGFSDMLALMSEISALPLPAAVETARSLVAFLAGLGKHPPEDEDLIQIVVLLQNLSEQICPSAGEDESEFELVTPIAPSGRNPHERVALLLENPALSTLLQDVLTSANFAPYSIARMGDLLKVNGNRPPLAIIADLCLSQQDPDTSQVMRLLRQAVQPPPHLFCIAQDSDFQARLNAVRLGATRFLKKPLDTDKLLAVLRGVTERAPQDPFRVLLVDDDLTMTLVNGDVLTQAGMDVKTVNDPAQAPSLAEDFRPDVIVVDMFMPGCNGLELASVLRQDEDMADTPILFLSADTSIHHHLLAMDLGGDDFLTKPVEPELLQASVRARAKRARMLKRIRHEHRHMAFRLHSLLSPRQHQTAQQAWGLDAVRRLLIAPNGESMALSTPEAALMKALAASPEHGASREQLIASLSVAPGPNDGTRLEALISRLRRKSVSRCGMKLPVRSEYGRGYSFAGRLRLL